MRDEQMSYRGSVVLGCVGLLMGITAACSGGPPLRRLPRREAVHNFLALLE